MRRKLVIYFQSLNRILALSAVLLLSSVSRLSCMGGKQVTLSPADLSAREKELSELVLPVDDAVSYYFEISNINENTPFEIQIFQAKDGKWTTTSTADFSLDNAGLFIVQARNNGTNFTIRISKANEANIIFPVSVKRENQEVVTTINKPVELDTKGKCILSYGSSDWSFTTFELDDLLQNDPQTENALALVLKKK